MVFAIMAVLLRLTGQPGVQAGDVFAGVSYGLNIILALDQGPVLVEEISRLVDIRRRVDKAPDLD